MLEMVAEQKPLANWIRALQPSPIQDLLALEDASITSFALGFPGKEFFPLTAFQRAAWTLLERDVSALQYMPTRKRLKQHIARIMQLRGVTCGEENIFLTAGAQQALSLLSHLLLNPGGTLVTETLTYTGMLRIVAPLSPNIVTVPTHPVSGIDLEALEGILAASNRPAFIYLVTDGHNPLGIRLSLEKRHALAELVRRYHVPLIEDDPYGFLYYGSALPPVRALENRQVFYVGSLSKVLAPALRIGWIVLPQELTARMSAVKEAMDLDSATFAQHLASQFFEEEDFPAHLCSLREGYRQRRDITAAALREHLPEHISWHLPECGMYFWLGLPDGVDTGTLLKKAVLTEKISFMPGNAFRADFSKPAPNGLRLCFSFCPLDEIEGGIQRLARVLAQIR